jgi:hypothetical protein
MPDRSSKKAARKKAGRRQDVNELAAAIVDAATREPEPESEAPEKNPAAVALGRLGGRKGGKARAEKLSAKKRSEIAKKAARARWGRAD